MRPEGPAGDGPQGQFEVRQALRQRARAGRGTAFGVTGGPHLRAACVHLIALLVVGAGGRAVVGQREGEQRGAVRPLPAF